MTQNPELKTSLGQRIGIFIIAIILLGSTAALYLGMVVDWNNSTSTTQVDTEKQARFEELSAQYQAQLYAYTTELSDAYFDQFVTYKSRVKSFNSAAITTVTTTDLKVGDGAEVTEDFSDYVAFYIGWLSDETVFDTSLDDFGNPSSLVSYLPGYKSVIEGWSQGVIGMRIGGVREISIPAELAYGDQEVGGIPANSPLKFIIMLVPINEPEYPEEMLQLYYELSGASAY